MSARPRRSFPAVFFDLGGTLIENMVPERWPEAANRASISADMDAVLHFEQEVRAENDRDGDSWSLERYWQQVLDRATGSPVRPSQVAKFLEYLGADPPVVHLFADVRDCLKRLRREHRRLGIISNSRSEQHVAELLELAGVRKYFAVVVSSGTERIRKPDPEIFHRAASRLGVLPSEAVHVGDLRRTDAVGATDAGLAGVWLNRAGTGLGDYPREITSLRELPREIRRIEESGG